MVAELWVAGAILAAWVFSPAASQFDHSPPFSVRLSREAGRDRVRGGQDVDDQRHALLAPDLSRRTEGLPAEAEGVVDLARRGGAAGADAPESRGPDLLPAPSHEVRVHQVVGAAVARCHDDPAD